VGEGGGRKSRVPRRKTRSATCGAAECGASPFALRSGAQEPSSQAVARPRRRTAPTAAGGAAAATAGLAAPRTGGGAAAPLGAKPQRYSTTVKAKVTVPGRARGEEATE
jgi:hypothetical protein